MRVALGFYLLLVNDVDASFDVWKGVAGGENGLAFVLLMQVSVCAAVQRERRAVNKAPQVVVLVKVRDAVLHLVRVEVRFHVSDLDESLGGEKMASVISHVGLHTSMHKYTVSSRSIGTLNKNDGGKNLKNSPHRSNSIAIILIRTFFLFFY